MGWKRTLGITVPAAISIIVGASTPAFASTDSGWVLSTDGNPGGSGYFDADLAGNPGFERIIACDDQADGFGVIATARDLDNGTSADISDPSSNGSCTAIAGNLFPDEHRITLQVCLFRDGEFNNFCSTRVAAVS